MSVHSRDGDGGHCIEGNLGKAWAPCNVVIEMDSALAKAMSCNIVSRTRDFFKKSDFTFSAVEANQCPHFPRSHSTDGRDGGRCGARSAVPYAVSFRHRLAQIAKTLLQEQKQTKISQQYGKSGLHIRCC